MPTPFSLLSLSFDACMYKEPIAENSFLNAGLTVYFEKTNYTVNESSREVMIGIVAEAGTQFRDVVVRVDALDGSAKCI